LLRVDLRRIHDAVGDDPPRAVVVPPEEAAVVALVTRGAALLHDAEENRVAVAVDGEVVRRADWVTTPLADRQAIEVVRAVQGG